MPNDATPFSALRWFVMRDLKRSNATRPAYVELSDLGFEVFTPVHTVMLERNGRKERRERPVIQDLLFVHSTLESLAPIVEKTPTLQFRYLKGAPYKTPMEVRHDDMERFMKVIGSSNSVRYYSSEEIIPSMIGKSIRIVGGPLDGFSGNLLSLRGLRKKRLVVNLDNLVAASVEIEPEFIEIL